jgi:hypothetical protein
MSQPPPDYNQVIKEEEDFRRDVTAAGVPVERPLACEPFLFRPFANLANAPSHSGPLLFPSHSPQSVALPCGQVGKAGSTIIPIRSTWTAAAPGIRIDVEPVHLATAAADRSADALLPGSSGYVCPSFGGDGLMMADMFLRPHLFVAVSTRGCLSVLPRRTAQVQVLLRRARYGNGNSILSDRLHLVSHQVIRIGGMLNLGPLGPPWTIRRDVHDAARSRIRAVILARREVCVRRCQL